MWSRSPTESHPHAPTRPDVNLPIHPAPIVQPIQYGKTASDLVAVNPGSLQLIISLAYKSRNRLSHGYYAVDQSILWNTASKSIPKTVAAARRAKLKYKHDGGNGTGGGASRGPPV